MSAEEPSPYLWIGTLRPSYWVEGSRAGLNQHHLAFKAESRRQQYRGLCARPGGPLTLTRRGRPSLMPT